MNISGVVKMLFNKVLGKNGTEEIKKAESRIETWRDVYSGNASWRNYEYPTLSGRIEKGKRKSLVPAKIVCSELAGLIFAEMPEIETDERVKEVLESNAFDKNIVTSTETMFALGAMILKLYIKDNKIKIDFLEPDCFIPISSDTSGIQEADILDRRVIDKKQYLRVEKHRRNTDGSYTITSEAFELALGNMVPVSLSLFGIEEAEQVSPTKLFYYIGNPEKNNLDTTSPLSISVFANALDTIESLDIAFHALQSEIVLGRKRIIVPAGAVRNIIDIDTGRPVRYFDPSDEVFQAFDVADNENLKITDNTVELRIDELRLAIQTLLDLLCLQVGFNVGYLSFDGTSMKTATEVISENSKTFKTKKYFENAIGSGIVDMLQGIRALLAYQNIPTSGDDTISWDDSIIEDRNSKAVYYQNRLLAGTVERWRAIKELDGCTEEEAKERADAIKDETATVDMGGLFGGSDYEG